MAMTQEFDPMTRCPHCRAADFDTSGAGPHCRRCGCIFDLVDGALELAAGERPCDPPLGPRTWRQPTSTGHGGDTRHYDAYGTLLGVGPIERDGTIASTAPDA